MAKGKDNTAKFNVGISGKIEAKTEIPSASSGRALDAIVDFFRPITETTGFLGDKIQLARQETLTKITQATKRRLEIANKPLKLPPLKLLIPLIERASLEDINDTKLVDMWANLIATASTEEVELLGQYTTVLSEITSTQVRIIEKILDIKEEDLRDAGHIVDMYWMLNQSGLPGTVNSLAQIEHIEEFSEALVDEFYRMGVALDTINIYYADKHENGNYSISRVGNLRPDLNFYDYENLVRLGMLSRCEIKSHIVGKYDVDVLYYIITPVGVDLYACCNPTRLRREERYASIKNKTRKKAKQL